MVFVAILALVGYVIEMQNFYYFAGLFSLGLIILICLIYWILNTFVTNPLNGIYRAIKDVEQGNIRQRIKYKPEDTIGLIAKHFNKILDRLEQEHHLASIGKLSSVLAHEIKSPLGGISGAIQVIDEEIPDNDSKKGIIAEVIKEIGRLDVMVKDFLQFSRPVPFSPKMNNLNKLIGDTIKLLKYKNKNVSFNTCLDNNISDICVDADKLQQAFLNICINAMESMEKGGTLTITTSSSHSANFEQTIKKNDLEYKHIQVLITDTGHGIPSETMQNIFTPFFTTKKKGHGLGLPISSRIIEKHGGTIRVESEPGKGAKFLIVLPTINNSEIQLDKKLKSKAGNVI